MSDYVPREMIAAEKQREREVAALERIAVAANTICAYFQMIVEGLPIRVERYRGTSKKKAKNSPSLAKRYAKRG